MYAALVWLHENNPFYNDVEIDRKNLEVLPEDGNVSNLLQFFADVGPSAEKAKEGEVDAIHVNVRQTGVPVATTHGQSKEIERHLAGFAVDFQKWPDIGTTAINEFNDEGYIAGAFPSVYFPEAQQTSMTYELHREIRN